jgi:hypothetical protein
VRRAVWNSRLRQWEERRPNKDVKNDAYVRGWHAGQFEGKTAVQTTYAVGTNVSKAQVTGKKTPGSMKGVNSEQRKVGKNGLPWKSQKWY